jgi:hypothetical protein
LALTPAGTYGPYTENFTGTTGDILATIGAPQWIGSTQYTSLRIKSNAVTNASGGNFYFAPVGNNQYAQAKVVTYGSSAGDLNVGVRITGGNGVYGSGSNENHYGYWMDVLWTGGQRKIELWKYWNNAGSDTWTQLGSSVNHAGSANDILRIEANGTTIRCLVNGVEKISETDTQFAVGFPGIAMFDANETMDDWEGGTLTTSQTAYPIADR